MIKNKARVFQGIDFWMTRVEGIGIAIFRKSVWELFCRILEETPQFSGRAVANWRIGINAPDTTFEADVGDDPADMHVGQYAGVRGIEPLRQKGDRYWIDYAKIVNKPRVRQIKRNDKVFITNSVVGDDDGGRSSVMYMESLQDPGYWALKLRAVNKPYETATETILKFSWADFEQVGGNLVEWI